MSLTFQELLANFHFLRPLWLLALAPAAMLLLLLRYLQGSQSSWSQAIDPSLLPYLLDRKLGKGQRYPLYGLFLLWALAIVALAGPVWKQIPIPVQEREDALVLVLDLSMSMYATDLRPNRITRAQRKLMDLLDYRREEGETALVVYAGDAHAVTPMTDDVSTIANLVPSLQPSIMPVLGSKPALGVNLALQLMANGSIHKGRILLLTDSIQPSDVSELDTLLAGSNATLSVMGFGTPEGAPIPIGQQGYLRDDNNAIVIPKLEREPLQRLASDNGGRYADAQIGDDDILFLLDQNRLAANADLSKVDDRDFDTWNDTGPWFLLLALPLAALGFRRGWLLGLLPLMLFTPDHAAYAWGWQDLWVNKNQQGLQAFEQESYGPAALDFKDPSWRAAANYRNENYEGTVQDLAGLDTVEANYNRGNALAHLTQYEAAIAAYDRVLAQQPDHADAQHNKELVEKLLEQQQQDQQNSSGDQQNSDQQQQGEQQDQQDGQQDQEQDQQQQSQDQQQQGEQQDQDQNQQQNQQDEPQQDQDQEQEESDQEQQQQPEQDELSQSEQSSSEEQQAMEQWLMRIPDDPGELLRNKFQYQTQQRLLQQLQNPALGQPKPGEPQW